jgi:hypothetical protein
MPGGNWAGVIMTVECAGPRSSCCPLAVSAPPRLCLAQEGGPVGPLDRPHDAGRVSARGSVTPP